jgi:EmrB/QacA subfamily drug resistance transporter
LTLHSPALPDHASRRQWLALVILCFGQLMIVLDGTVVNVALPDIQSQLHFRQADLAWVVNAYLVAFGGLLLLAGRLGDLFGKKRVFLAGLSLFTVASLLCGLAENQATLIGARFLQGIGAAMQASMVLGMLSTLFPSGRTRARAFSVYAFCANIGGSIGLLVGGMITQLLSWHWIFFINLPIGVLGVAMAIKLLDNPPSPGAVEVDVLGGLLVIAAPTLAVYTIVSSPTHGWASGGTLAQYAGVVLMVVALIGVERHAKNPLLPPRLFQSRTVIGANLVRFFNGVAMSSLFFLTTLYLQEVLGFSPIGAGFSFIPFNVIISFGSIALAPLVLDRVYARKPLIPALVLDIVGMLLMTRIHAHGSYVASVLPSLVVLAIGQSFLFLPTVRLAMNDVASPDAGLASGIANVSFQFGASLGVALSGGVSSFITTRLLAEGNARHVALARGFGDCFFILTGALVAAAISSRVIPASSGPLRTPSILEVPVAD